MSGFDQQQFLSLHYGPVTALRRFSAQDQDKKQEQLSRFEASQLVLTVGADAHAGSRSTLIALAELAGVIQTSSFDRMQTSYLVEQVIRAVERGDLVVLRGWTWPQPVARSARSAIPDVPAPPRRSSQAARPESAVRRRIELDHRYHDDEPVQGAEFTLRLADGSERKGKLDRNGRAVIEDVPDGPASVQFGPDARPYELINKQKNPDYKEKLTPSDIDALIKDAMVAG